MRSFSAGTRGSALALWQTKHVAALLGVDVRLEVITTRGDVDMRERLQGKLEKGFFTQEIEDALRAKRVDFAVHSLKDLPTRDPPGLTVVAVPERAHVHDLLIARSAELPKGARVGASSLRRASLVAAFLPGAQSVPLRGNVPTRVERLKNGDYDAIVIARAGIERLGLDLSGLSVKAIDPRRWTPAPGQGAIGVQGRSDDLEMRALAAKIEDASAARATAWERAFLAVLEGGCTTPFGCYVEKSLHTAWLGMDQGGAWRFTSVALPGPAPDEAFITSAVKRLEQANAAPSAPAKDLIDEPLFESLR